MVHGGEISIRPMVPGDLEAVVKIYTRAVRELTGEHYTPEQIAVWAGTQPDLDRWRDRLAEVVTRVAEIGGQPVGFLSFRPDGYIDLTFTAPEFARRGVARSLYRAAEQELRDRGVQEFTVHASLVAKPFFAGEGYVEVEREVVHRSGVELPRWLMRKG